jgi:hypothetical protein
MVTQRKRVKQITLLLYPVNCFKMVVVKYIKTNLREFVLNETSSYCDSVEKSLWLENSLLDTAAAGEPNVSVPYFVMKKPLMRENPLYTP